MRRDLQAGLRPLVCLLLVGASILRGQTDPNDPLTKIRRQVVDGIRGLPNYLCTETVHRETLSLDPFTLHKTDVCGQIVGKASYSPDAFKLVSSDRLRLDVAIISGKEMYSWVGAGRFNDIELSDLVKQGTTSTGSFGSFLIAIFGSGAADFTFKGESQINGRNVLEYAFEVPISRSGYIISTETTSRVTGYRGTFTADAQTFDLLRLEIQPDALASELQICQSTTRLDYTRVHMNSLSVLLPSEVNVRMLATDGHQSHTRTVFSGCHQFLGESKLIFDEAPAQTQGDVVAASKSKAIALPPRLKVVIALTDNIDPATAAGGDPTTGRLTRAIKDQASGLTIPKGAKVSGRIFGLLTDHGEQSYLEFALKWDSIEVEGVSQPVDLSVISANSGSAKLQYDHGHFPEVQSMSRAEERGVGFFLFPQVPKSYRIPAGFETEWSTEPLAAEPK